MVNLKIPGKTIPNILPERCLEERLERTVQILTCQKETEHEGRSSEIRSDFTRFNILFNKEFWNTIGYRITLAIMGDQWFELLILP